MEARSGKWVRRTLFPIALQNKQGNSRILEKYSPGPRSKRRSRSPKDGKTCKPRPPGAKWQQVAPPYTPVPDRRYERLVQPTAAEEEDMSFVKSPHTTSRSKGRTNGEHSGRQRR